MKSYHQYCPVARGAELFAERWTPIIIRNIKMGCHNFSEILRGAPGLSKTLLADRLRSLAQAGVVQVTPNPRGRGSVYHLTEAGEDLVKVVLELGNWGARWTEIEVEHMDPYVVLWVKCRDWDLSALPDDRVVLRFDITDFRQPFWIVAEREAGAELCVKHPGFAEDVIVTTDRESLTLWQAGHLSYPEALATERMKVEGRRDLVRTFSRWVPISHFADVEPAATAR